MGHDLGAEGSGRSWLFSAVERKREICLKMLQERMLNLKIECPAKQEDESLSLSGS